MNVHGILFGFTLAVAAVGPAMAVEVPNAESHDNRSQDGQSPNVAAARPLSALHVDVYAALRAEALSRRQGPNVPDVMRLVDLYRELAAHPKRDDSPLVRELGLKLRSRLKEVREHVERRIAKVERHADKMVLVATLAAPETQVLAQQVAVPGGALGQGAAAGQPVIAPVATPAIDYGPQLVALIQATISPATWDINGGPSSIVYFAPLRVLVVSAPDPVHAQLGGVLGQLR